MIRVRQVKILKDSIYSVFSFNTIPSYHFYLFGLQFTDSIMLIKITVHREVIEYKIVFQQCKMVKQIPLIRTKHRRLFQGFNDLIGLYSNVINEKIKFITYSLIFSSMFNIIKGDSLLQMVFISGIGLYNVSLVNFYRFNFNYLLKLIIF